MTLPSLKIQNIPMQSITKKSLKDSSKNKNLSREKIKKERIRKISQNRILKVNLKSKIKIAKIKIKKVKRAMKSNSKTSNKMKLQRSRRAPNRIVSKTRLVNRVMKNSKINSPWSNGFEESRMILVNYYEENLDINIGNVNLTVPRIVSKTVDKSGEKLFY